VAGEAVFINCHSDFVGSYPHIDMNGSGNSLLVRDYSGELGLQNYAGGGDVTLDFDSGFFHVDSTVTAGTVIVRGICAVHDDSTGTATVYDRTISYDAETARKLLENRQELVDTGADVRMRTYEDDGTTVFEESVVTDSAGDKPKLAGITNRGAPQ